MQHVLRVWPSEPAPPAWCKLMEEISWWVRQVPADLDQAQARRQVVKATERELVPVHDDGADAEGAQVRPGVCRWLVCGGHHVEYAGQERSRGQAA